ncbi:WYL domain-containing protein [Nocardioides sp.]|uniref:WYL domain-containing protein n=1 Tax=Nocardioides sp. TaxID=35761 RepID=UPI002B278124|nr:WYL domain-containing protein [Nocardioides sp.]
MTLRRHDAGPAGPHHRRRRVQAGDLELEGALGTDGWSRATCRVHSFEAAVLDVLSLAPHIEVLEPERLRATVADRTRRSAALYSER